MTASGTAAAGLRDRGLRLPVPADRRPDPVLLQRLAAELRLARASPSTGIRRLFANEEPARRARGDAPGRGRRGDRLDGPGHAAGARPGPDPVPRQRRVGDAAAAADGDPRDRHGHQPAAVLRPAVRRSTGRSARSRSPTSRSASRTWRSSSGPGRPGLDPRLEEAARDLGASAWGAFWHVTLPLIAPAVAAGAMLAFALSFDDLIVTTFNAGVGCSTLPLLHLLEDPVRGDARDQRDLDDHRRGDGDRDLHRLAAGGLPASEERELVAEDA